MFWNGKWFEVSKLFQFMMPHFHPFCSELFIESQKNASLPEAWWLARSIFYVHDQLLFLQIVTIHFNIGSMIRINNWLPGWAMGLSNTWGSVDSFLTGFLWSRGLSTGFKGFRFVGTVFLEFGLAIKGDALRLIFSYKFGL